MRPTTGSWTLAGTSSRRGRCFEAEWASYCGVKHCVGVGNGLEALHLILRAMGIGAGDEVIVPSNTYIATWLAVSFAGARGCLSSLNAQTHNIDPGGSRPRHTADAAVLPVHLYGQPADMTLFVSCAAVWPPHH